MRRALFFLAIIAVAAVSYAQSGIDYYDSLCRDACIDASFSEDAAAMCNDLGYEGQVEASTDACFGAVWNGYLVEKCFCGAPSTAGIPEEQNPEFPESGQTPTPSEPFTTDKCGTYDDIAQCYYDEACGSIGDCCSGFDYKRDCGGIAAPLPPETTAYSEAGGGGYGKEFTEISTSAEKECPAASKLGDCENIDNKLGGKQCYFVPQKPSALTIKSGDIVWTPFEGDFLTNIFGAIGEATKQIGGKCEACPASAEKCDYANQLPAPGSIKKEVCERDMCGQGCKWLDSSGTCIPIESSSVCSKQIPGATCVGKDKIAKCKVYIKAGCPSDQVCCTAK
ncbi:MAG: hypothetical protein HYW26_03620 [Candidatus Aenigmarchaeota archaeon]|nr:hypothetical protein [Candidatus Aenigmarchaeota archaeon]